jgi:hypothetical protein
MWLGSEIRAPSRARHLANHPTLRPILMGTALAFG